jgi:hypothetical protein
MSTVEAFFLGLMAAWASPLPLLVWIFRRSSGASSKDCVGGLQ